MYCEMVDELVKSLTNLKTEAQRYRICCSKNWEEDKRKWL